MIKPQGSADRLLLNAAKELACHTGCSGLRIRDVAAHAGVNLGMFHYHFKSKKRFTRVLLQELYEDFFARLSLASREEGTALKQLRGSLLVMGKFTRDHRNLLGALWKDILNSDPEVLQFVRRNVPRHAAVVQQLIVKCQKEGTLPEVPFAQAMGFTMAGLNVPSLVAGRLALLSVVPGGSLESILSDRAIEQRVDMILAGLKKWKE